MEEALTSEIAEEKGSEKAFSPSWVTDPDVALGEGKRAEALYRERRRPRNGKNISFQTDSYPKIPVFSGNGK